MTWFISQRNPAAAAVMVAGAIFGSGGEPVQTGLRRVGGDMVMESVCLGSNSV